jgi:hypothetical protein
MAVELAMHDNCLSGHGEVTTAAMLVLPRRRMMALDRGPRWHPRFLVQFMLRLEWYSQLEVLTPACILKHKADVFNNAVVVLSESK